VVLLLPVVLLIVGVLHLGFLQLSVLVGGRLLFNLLADIGIILVGRLVVSRVLLLVL
jgi:hypothetical protein